MHMTVPAMPLPCLECKDCTGPCRALVELASLPEAVLTPLQKR